MAIFKFDSSCVDVGEGKTCRYCMHWSGKKCSHHRHKNEDMLHRCPLYNYKIYAIKDSDAELGMLSRVHKLTTYHRQHIVVIIARKMAEKKITQDDIAARTGLSKSVVKGLISGNKKPKVDELRLLAGVLGISIEDFFVVDKNNEKPCKKAAS